MPGLAPESAEAVVQYRSIAAPEGWKGALMCIQSKDTRTEKVNLQRHSKSVDHVDGNEASCHREEHAIEIQS